MTTGDMPPWPASDSPDDAESFTDLIQHALNTRFALEDGTAQVVVGWVLVADVAAGNGGRGLQMLTSEQTPYWTALGYLDGMRLDIQREVLVGGDDEPDDDG